MVGDGNLDLNLDGWDDVTTDTFTAFADGLEKTAEPCVVCGAPVYDYKPKMCCNGSECGCKGLPLEPCTCSKDCEKIYREK